MELLSQRECGRECCVDCTLRLTMRTFDKGGQPRVGDLRVIPVDAYLSSLKPGRGARRCPEVTLDQSRHRSGAAGRVTG